MKTLYLLAAATAVIATPAFAQESSNNHDVTVTVQAATPAKCNIAADDQTVTLANYDLTNDNGRARGNVGALTEIIPGERDLAQKLLTAATPAVWADVWDKIGHLARRTDAVNLDKKRSLMLMLMAVESAVSQGKAA